jgi:hypothetical protein
MSETTEILEKPELTENSNQQEIDFGDKFETVLDELTQPKEYYESKIEMPETETEAPKTEAKQESQQQSGQQANEQQKQEAAQTKVAIKVLNTIQSKVCKMFLKDKAVKADVFAFDENEAEILMYSIQGLESKVMKWLTETPTGNLVMALGMIGATRVAQVIEINENFKNAQKSIKQPFPNPRIKTDINPAAARNGQPAATKTATSGKRPVGRPRKNPANV